MATSVHAHLLRIAHERGEELQRLLVLFALERLLYRLGRSDHAKKLVLKGAMLFQVWEGSLPRTTRDLDLLGVGESSAAAALTAFRELWCIDDVEDGLELDPDSLRTETIRDQGADIGLRIKCRVRLGNAVVPLQVDVGSGDAVRPSPRLIEYPTLLDPPAPRILAYPKEAVVAEKAQAMVELGLLNSRLKNYFDLCHLARTQRFDGVMLQDAIQATFKRRETPIPQAPIEGLGPEFAASSTKRAQWAGFQRRAGLPPEELSVVVETVRALVEPVVLALAGGARRWLPIFPGVVAARTLAAQEAEIGAAGRFPPLQPVRTHLNREFRFVHSGSRQALAARGSGVLGQKDCRSLRGRVSTRAGRSGLG